MCSVVVVVVWCGRFLLCLVVAVVVVLVAAQCFRYFCHKNHICPLASIKEKRQSALYKYL